jgi:4-hydroxybenzoate polyprenyltransferase
VLAPLAAGGRRDHAVIRLSSRTLAYARLLRLPNVFTAPADIGLGLLAAGGAVPWPAAALLCVSSAALYCGGMVWNDYFDLEQDRRERPFRPLPSGAVTLAAAMQLGVALLAGGWLAAALAGFRGHGFDPTPAVVAGLLVAAILLYDRWLKRTSAGPVGMGMCRFLNVLLGCSVAGDAVPWGLRLHLAGVVGLYIVGVTWFARSEARQSEAHQLRRAAGVMAAALALALPLPLHLPDGTASPLFPYLLVVFGFVIGIPAGRAWVKPEPARVQAAVKRAVLGLIVLDAVLATAVAGAGGLVLLALLPPALVLGQWLYST